MCIFVVHKTNMMKKKKKKKLILKFATKLLCKKLSSCLAVSPASLRSRFRYRFLSTEKTETLLSRRVCQFIIVAKYIDEEAKYNKRSAR